MAAESFDWQPMQAETPLRELPPRDQLDASFALREAADQAEVPDDLTVKEIQASVGAWLRDELDPTRLRYGNYDVVASADRFGRLHAFLRDKYGDTIPKVVLDASDAFIASTISMYNSRPERGGIAEDADGSFGFVVPARAERGRPEYSRETIAICPSTRYIPDDLRAVMFVGLPPFVLDRYQIDEHGQRGYLLFAPVFPDMANDLSLTDAARVVREVVNDTVRFAHDRFGINTVGLGAVLPAYTRYGQSIDIEGVETTTGHAGTIALILETVRAIQEQRALSENALNKIGVLGLGSIGASIASVVAELYPNAEITVYDPATRKVQDAVTAMSALGRSGAIKVAENARNLLEESGVIISAVTGKIDLDAEGIGRLDDKIIVDDSQPGSFDPDEVERRGSHVVWVVGQDSTGGIAQRQSSWNYGGTIDGNFGCELEAAVLSRVRGELGDYGLQGTVIDTEEVGDVGRRKRSSIEQIMHELALHKAVTPADVKRFHSLFEHYGITAAPLQANGRRITLDRASTAEVPEIHVAALPSRSHRLRQAAADITRRVAAVFLA